MFSSNLRKYFCLLVLIIPLLVCACEKEKVNVENKTEKKLNVVCTMGMIADIAENVGGDRIDITCIIGEGVDPHLYKPTARDTIVLKEADIIFYNGLHLEVRITGSVLDKMNDKTHAIAVADDIDRSQLRRTSEFIGGYDPHVWHDVSLWMKATEKIRDTLLQRDSHNAEYYRSKANYYLSQLVSLHYEMQKLSSQIPIKQRVLVTTHDAFGYLGKAYGFEVRGLLGINTEDEVGIADVTNLAAYIIENGISTMFLDTSSPPRGIFSVQEAVQAKGFNVNIGSGLFSDAMGSPGTPEGTYIGMMRHNMNTIVNMLQSELAYRE